METFRGFLFLTRLEDVPDGVVESVNGEGLVSCIKGGGSESFPVDMRSPGDFPSLLDRLDGELLARDFGTCSSIGSCRISSSIASRVFSGLSPASVSDEALSERGFEAADSMAFMPVADLPAGGSG